MLACIAMIRIPLAAALCLVACGSGARTAPPAIQPEPAVPAPPAAAAPAAAATAAAPPASAPPPDIAWSESRFADQLQAAIHHRFPAATITPLAEDAYRVALPPPGASVDVDFGNAHRSCRDDWAGCQQAVAWTLQAMTDTMQPPPVTAAQLRIILRGNPKIAAYQAQGGPLITRPFSSDAQWLLIADLPTMMRFQVNAADLGMTDDQAWRTAIANMKKPPAALISTAADIAIVYQDAYAPSALLDPTGLEQAVHKQFPRRTGALLAVCPEEDVILYTLGGHDEAVRLRAAVAKLARQALRPLSPQVMEWSNGAWRPALKD